MLLLRARMVRAVPRTGGGREIDESSGGVSEQDSTRIIRQWNREIETEIRRERARERDDGPWKAVAWAALWLVWLVALVALLGHLKGLR